MFNMPGTYQSLAGREKDLRKMRSKSSSRTPDLLAAIAKDLSHSGFYCTPDLEQNAELRILYRCYSNALSVNEAMGVVFSDRGFSVRDIRPRLVAGLRCRLKAQAVSALRSALEVYTREQLSQDWAMTQNNLGTALSNLADRTEGPKGAELLAQAVSALRSALEVYTREQLPQVWAVTQSNLGTMLLDQATRTKGPKGAKLLAQAVSACQSALEVQTREQLPKDWARAQNILGLALLDQADRTEGTEGAKLLAQAVAAFHSCLEIYTLEAFPLDHKRAQNDLKMCDRLLKQLRIKLNSHEIQAVRRGW
jgi:hypothetical protein